jgi:hypothetical protein
MRKHRGIGGRSLVGAAAAVALAAVLQAPATGARAQTLQAMEARSAALNAQPIPYATSEAHYEALKREARGGTRHTYATLPDWTGFWTRAASAATQHAKLPLKPEYAAAFAKLTEQVKQGIEWDHLSYCLPAGYPRTNNEPFLKEFILRPDQAWLINEMVSEVRRVYTDGRGHPPADEAFPLWTGHSIGFWKGDTLVVHTNNVMGFPSGYSRSSPPQSDQLTSVEEWRKLGPDLIELVTTIYDPGILTRPYRLVNQYVRVKEPGTRIDQWVCNENNRAVRTAEGATQFILPGEAGDKAPGLAGFLQQEQQQSAAPAPAR